MTEEEKALKQLDSFLEENSPQLTQMFKDLFEGQQNLLTDEELIEAVKNNFEQEIKTWHGEYKTFVEAQYMPIFKEAIKTGAEKIEQEYSISLDFNDSQIKSWLESYSEQFLNNMVNEMESSIANILEKCQEKDMTPRETVQFI